jgi:hypothetical protein
VGNVSAVLQEVSTFDLDLAHSRAAPKREELASPRANCGHIIVNTVSGT